MKELTRAEQKLNWIRKYGSSICTFAYFLAMIILNQMTSSLGSVFWYVTVLACVLTGLLSHRLHLSNNAVFFISFCLVSGLLNMMLVGNSSLSKQVFLIFGVFMAWVMADDGLDPNCLLAALYLNVAVVAYHFVRYGVYEQAYATASNNFVSVQLLYPAVIYYTVLERQGKRITVFPAALVWLFSLLAAGRGGILTCTLFLGLLLAYLALKGMKKWPAGERHMVITAVAVVAAVAVIAALGNLSQIIARHEIFRTFADRGLRSSRSILWSGYWEECFRNLRYLLFGGSNKEISVLGEFSYNLHNSFFAVHQYNGIIMLVYVLALCIRSFMYGFREKRWVFLICFATLFLRSATDFAFWTVYGTPVFFFFLFLPDERHYGWIRRERTRTALQEEVTERP